MEELLEKLARRDKSSVTSATTWRTEYDSIFADARAALLSSSERVKELEAVLTTMVEEFDDGSQSPYRRGLCADARSRLLTARAQA